MPSAYVKKLAQKHGVSTKTAERKWDEAKKMAKKADPDDFYAYTTKIFKNMMGEKSSVMDVLQREPLLAFYKHAVERAKKWSADVETKWSPPEGFFKHSGEKIAEGLKRAPGGLSKAMQRLNFYINRAGKNLTAEDRKRLNRAKEILMKDKE